MKSKEKLLKKEFIDIDRSFLVIKNKINKENLRREKIELKESKKLNKEILR